MVMEAATPLTVAEATEAWLSGHGVVWTYEAALPLARIDKVASLANQARLEPLSEEVVDRYVADLERGDVFPAVIVNQAGSAKSVVLVGGNHRAVAHERAKRSTIAAYVIDVADDVALRLAYEDNRRHGLAPSEDERILQAVHLARNGASQGEAARIVGLSIGKVNRGIAVVRADAQARELGVEGWLALPRTVRWRLSSLEDPDVFEAAARMVATMKVGANDVYDLVTRLAAAGDTLEALRIVGEEEEARSELGKRAGGAITRTSSPRAKMLEALRVIAALDSKSVVASCTSEDHRAVLAQRIMAAARNLQSTHQALSS
jgi:hypothetical protein